MDNLNKKVRALSEKLSYFADLKRANVLVSGNDDPAFDLEAICNIKQGYYEALGAMWHGKSTVVAIATDSSIEYWQLHNPIFFTKIETIKFGEDEGSEDYIYEAFLKLWHLSAKGTDRFLNDVYASVCEAYQKEFCQEVLV